MISQDNKVRNLKGEVVGYIEEWHDNGFPYKWIPLVDIKEGEELSFPRNIALSPDNVIKLLGGDPDEAIDCID